MNRMISTDVLVAYSQCPHKAYLLLFTKQKGKPHEYVQILQQQKATNQQQFIKTLKEKLSDAQPYAADKLKDRHAFLTDVTLQNREFEAACGLLTKVDVASSLGRYSYEPGIFTGTYTVTKEQRLQVIFAGHILAQLQGKHPATGRIINMEGRSTKVKLEDSHKILIPMLEPLQEWLSDASPETPPIILNKHCPLCQFRNVCQAKAEQEDNLSLLDRVTPKAVRQYEKKGIFTVKQLSYLYKPRKRKKRAKNPPTPTHKIELQALAIRTEKIYLQELPQLIRQPVELFLDIEGVPDRGIYYLIGLLVCEGETAVYHSFWADSHQDEEKIWQQFLAKTDQYPDAPIYHYGSYEPRAIAKLARRYKTDGETVINRLINVNKHIYGKVYFPVHSNSLKVIGAYIGATWTSPDASGLQSLAWRHYWDATHTREYFGLLVAYNEEDCLALKLVTNALSEMNKLENCVNVQNIQALTRSQYARIKYEIDDFELIVRCAYFDYQREKIYFRGNKNIRKNYVKQQKKRQKKYRINQYIDTRSPQYCPNCQSTDLRPYQNHNPKIVIDLRFFDGGIKRWVKKYARKRVFCSTCKKAFLPDNVKGLNKYGRNLMVWSVNQLIAHRMSVEKIEETLAESFNLHLRQGVVYDFKTQLSEAYQTTYNEIKQSILDGELIHTDETRVSTKSGSSYVWVFTNLHSVFYTFRATRETEFLADMLTTFQGVLVSDFYPGYDSLQCLQQKCLIHLVRDLNDDLFKNPQDLEFRQLVAAFGKLLRLIVATIDQYGLKKRNLNKHWNDVAKFYQSTINQSSKSALTQKYQKRFRKYKEALFTFLNHDSIPWNNNNAEHAIKPFAAYRRSRDGLFTKQSIQEYLILLSIQQTCRYQEVSFFEFLKSGKDSLVEFTNG